MYTTFGYSQNNQTKQDMLNQGNKIITFLLLSCLVLVSCSNKTKSFKEASLLVVTKIQYDKIYTSANDSIKTWALNNLSYYEYFGKSKNYELDSLLCFNSKGERFISCILQQQLLKNAPSDGIDYFFGEKINNKWYFFTGPFIVVPRSMVKGHDQSAPLSYSQLHNIALKEVYSGYLKSNGEINEEWFINHFEGPGWGFFDQQEAFDWFLHGKRFTNKKEYFEFVHLQSAVSQWESRDTTQPIKLLNKEKTLP